MLSPQNYLTIKDLSLLANPEGSIPNLFVRLDHTVGSQLIAQKMFQKFSKKCDKSGCAISWVCTFYGKQCDKLGKWKN